MSTATRQPLPFYLDARYPFNVIAATEGGYVIVFPDLPGCMTQVETLDDVPGAANEIRRLWIESEYEAGADIPLPTTV